MIKRDGACVSPWQDCVEPYKPANRPAKNHIYDVIIAGGGITGISTAFLLQQAGKSCLVLEANNLCFGTTGGTTAHLNTLLDTPYNKISSNFSGEKAKLVASCVREAIDFIRNNIQTLEIDCGFEEAEAILFAVDDKQSKELDKVSEAANEAGVVNEFTEEIPIAVPFTKAIRVKGQAKFIPTKYVHALAEGFEKAGGVIIQQCRIRGAEQGDHVSVETSIGEFRCRDLVYATHIPPGVNLLHLRCIPYRSYAMAITLKKNEYPEELIYDMEDPYHYYRTQEIDGQKYLIGGGCDHKTAHGEDTEHYFQELEAHLRGIFPLKEIAYKWSSQYFEPADGIPYIGHLPGHPGHIFTATGYGGNGMVYSSVAAMLLKRMILNEPSPYQDLYNPNRIKPVAGFTNFIKHNADVVKQYADKLFSADELQELAGLAPGEGKVVKYNDHKIALFKDEDGKLHAISPTCTHLKCEVKWNGAERSWDCPCHGARYSLDGEVLNGPADADLEIVKLRELAIGLR
jgi:glycine/D-amino acid oxidase-like deaminating enzyme/nitrite reductase/ring-hydroxylating ferredoxin subunit